MTSFPSRRLWEVFDRLHQYFRNVFASSQEEITFPMTLHLTETMDEECETHTSFGYQHTYHFKLHGEQSKQLQSMKLQYIWSAVISLNILFQSVVIIFVREWRVIKCCFCSSSEYDWYRCANYNINQGSRCFFWLTYNNITKAVWLSNSLEDDVLKELKTLQRKFTACKFFPNLMPNIFIIFKQWP